MNVAEFEKATKALLRTCAAIEAMGASAEGRCCPTCYHGKAYTVACDKLDRQVAWLEILVAKAIKDAKHELVSAAEHAKRVVDYYAK
jgi:hypothetical protein